MASSLQQVPNVEESADQPLNDGEEKLPSKVENKSIEPNYSKLKSMFPNVDPEYIRKICVDPPFDESEESPLVMAINHLLSYEEQIDESELSKMFENEDEDFFSTSSNILSELMEEDMLQENETIANDLLLSKMLVEQDIEAAKQEKQSEEILNEQLLSEFLHLDKEVVDQKLEILENILPDADPELLRKYVEENRDNAQSLEQFVESKLMDKNYNKRDQYFESIRKKENINQYTTDFKVERFIKQFPDPFEHFENPDRQCTYQEKVLQFLKTRYSDQMSDLVGSEYTINKYNLSLTDKFLQVKLGKPVVAQINIDFNDIPFLQEVAFIENKNCIKDYLDQLRKKEEKEMQIWRARKLLLECQCCYDEMKPTETIECDNNHIFCRKCIIKGTNLAISDSEPSLRCFMGCDKEINLSILRRVLPVNIFEKFLKVKQDAEIRAAQLDNLVNCPFCNYSMELAPEIKIFTCKNPECKKITCRLCKKMNHLPFKCEEVLDEHKARLLVEESMSKTYIRYCYKCNKPFVKSHGCNKMQCSCGALMCYICKQPITGYEHFDRDNRCTTHRNSDMYDKEMVELSRVETTSKIRKDFPDLKLPDLPEA